MPDDMIGLWSDAERRRIAEWVGERPETVLCVHALRSGAGRLWLEGTPDAPRAVVIESALTPGEPQGFGQVEALFACLERAEAWDCIEIDVDTAASLREGFERRWGIDREVIDVIHLLDRQPPDVVHPLVRRLAPSDLGELTAADLALLPASELVEPAAAAGRLHAAVDGTRIVGHGSSFASGARYADVGVAVHPAYRRQHIATAAAARTCRQLEADGLRPVWGTGTHNTASLRTAARLGFREVARLIYLVRSR